MLYLGEEVVEVELVFLNAALQTLRLLLVVLLLRTLHEAHDVAHAENAVGHTLGVEHVEGFHFLARAHKLNGLIHHGAYRKGSTAARVAVEFREHHAVEVEAFVELLSRVHGVLTRHGVHHEERFVGLRGLLNGGNLAHQFLIDGEAAGCIDNHRVVALCLGLVDTFAGYLHGVFAFEVHINGHLYLLCQHAQLLHGCGAIYVARHEQRLAASLVLEQQGELAAEGRLTRTVETCHEDYGWVAFEIDIGSLPAHKLRQFVVHDFHEQLSRLHGREHVLPECLCLDLVGE